MDKEEGQQNMISNLPLLFASGYPTSLEKITETQLENFIPFMVQCSLGHINTQGKVRCGEPEWWPEDVPFGIPFTKPRKFNANWMAKMKEIVLICYQFHKSTFLLKFCNDLASYEHASLRFINNYNSTTSLFDRRNNKLLVTFRNENMSYDQPQRSRKCLLKQKKNGNSNGGEMQQMMVEPAPFDIYLCDNCDAELYSKEAILEHEKTCNVDAEDVILCDTPEPDRQALNETHVNAKNVNAKSNDVNKELRNLFLLNFNLQCSETDAAQQATCSISSNTTPNVDNGNATALKRRRRMTRRNRAVHSLIRCPTIPLSSPAGQLLLRSRVPCTTPEYIMERLERAERFCHAPVITKAVGKPKYLEKRYIPNCFNITFKKPADYYLHKYVFPRRQLRQGRRNKQINLMNEALLRRCRPISVRLKKLSPDQELQNNNNFKRSASASSNSASSGVSSCSSNLNIKLTRDTTRSSNWKISNPASEVIVDTIDLCSSDDEQTHAAVSQINNTTTATTAEATDFVLNTTELTVTTALPAKTQLMNVLRTRMRLSNTVTDNSIDKIATENANVAATNTKLQRLERTRSPSNRHTISVDDTTLATMSKNKTVFPQTLRSSVYLFSTNVNSNHSQQKLPVLTETLPLSKSGHNRQNNIYNNNINNSSINNNNNNNSYNNNNNNNNNLLKKTSELSLNRDIIMKPDRSNSNHTSAPPANWLGSATISNNNLIFRNQNNNNNLNNINNTIQLPLSNNVNIIVEPITTTPATAAIAMKTFANNTMNNTNKQNNMNQNHCVEACTSPNLNIAQNHIISIDLTL